MGAGDASAGASAVQKLRNQQHPTREQQPKQHRSHQERCQIQQQHCHQKQHRRQTEQQQQQHELQQQQQHEPQQEIEQQRGHWHGRQQVSLVITSSAIGALLSLLCVYCCCMHLSTPPAVGSKSLGRRLPTVLQGSAGRASRGPQTAKKQIASANSVYLQEPSKRHRFISSGLSGFAAVLRCPSLTAAAAAPAQHAATANANTRSSEVVVIDTPCAVKKRAAVQQHAAPAAIDVSLENPSCWEFFAAAAAADQTRRGPPRVAAACHSVSHKQVTPSPEHNREDLHAAATAGAPSRPVGKRSSRPAAAAEPLASPLSKTAGRPSAAHSASATASGAPLNCAAVESRLSRRQAPGSWCSPLSVAVAACMQASEGNKNFRCCLGLLLCASPVALQTSAWGGCPQAFCMCRKHHNSNSGRRLQGSSSCEEKSVHGRGNSKCRSLFTEDFCGKSCGESSRRRSQRSVPRGRSSRDWLSSGCSNSSRRRRTSSKRTGFFFLWPGATRKHLRWSMARGGGRCFSGIVSAASVDVSVGTDCCCSSSQNASNISSKGTREVVAAARRAVTATEAFGKCNRETAHLSVGLFSAARTAERGVVAAAKEAAAEGTAAAGAGGAAAEGAQGEGAARTNSKRKRRRYFQIGTVPAELLENVVAERKGKRPSARALRQMQRKPPRHSSGLLSLLETRFRCFNQQTLPAAAPVEPSGPLEAAGEAAANASTPTSAATACTPHLAAAAWEGSSPSDAAALRRAAEAIQEQRVRELAAAAATGRLGVSCGDVGWGRSEAAALAAAAKGAARAPQQAMPTGGWGRLRVCGGEQAGRRLLTPSQSEAEVRPMMAKVKEALFSILQQLGWFHPLTVGGTASSQQRVLDLFSGSGALAVESLSRGAASALLVDSSLESCQAAAVNLRHCAMTEKSRVIRATVEDVLISPERFLPNLSRRLWLQQPHYMQQLQLLLEAQKQQTAQQHEAKNKHQLEGRRDKQPRVYDGPRSFQQSGDQQQQPREMTLSSTLVTEQETDRQIYNPDNEDVSQLQECADEILRIEAEEAAQDAFSLVFACPPYTGVVYKDLIQLLLRCCIIGDDALVVIEYPKEIGCLPRLIKDENSPAALIGLRNRLYGRTCLAVYAKQKLFGLCKAGTFCGVATDCACPPAASAQDLTVTVDATNSNAAKGINFVNISCGEHGSGTKCAGTDACEKGLGVHSLSILADAGSGKEAASKCGTVHTSDPSTSNLCGAGGEWRHTRYMSSSALSNTRWLCEEYDGNPKPPVEDSRTRVIDLLPQTSRWRGHEKGNEFVPLFMNKKQLLAKGWLTRRRRAGSSDAKKIKEGTADTAART